MRLRRLSDQRWLEAAASARVTVALGDWPHHLELWPGWDTQKELDSDLVYALLAGDLRYHHRGDWHRVSAPATLWFPAGYAVRLACFPEATVPTLRRLRWRVERDGALLAPRGGPRVRDAHGPAVGLLDQLASEAERDDPIAVHRRRALVIAVACHLLEPPDSPARDPWQRRLDEVERDVARLLREDGSLPSPRDLARWCDLSHDYFARRFRAAKGLSPRVWLSRLRLAEAARRLQASERSATTIAEELGFEDPRVFNRAFRERYGMPPGRWRERAGSPL